MTDEPKTLPGETEIPPQVKGGQARAESLTPEERSEIARQAAVARWTDPKDRLPRATHEGPLKLGDVEIQCAVLQDGTRVISRAGFIRAIGRTGKAKGGRKYDNEFGTPVFLTAENLKSFIPNELTDNSRPIQYRTLGGTIALGYRWELLSLVCNVFIDALLADKLQANQVHIAEQCRILNRAFASVGLAALIDEATGYQEVRDRTALQEILDLYLRKEFAAWAKRFPDEFYRQIYRLKGWKWFGMAKNRKPLIGKYTNDLVYDRLTSGLLDDLQTRNPKDERGKRKAKHHQWLTEGIGHPRLAEHLYGLIGLMRAFPDGGWNQFKVALQSAYPKKGSNLDIFLDSGQPE
jgi:hypothetical protein